MFKSEANLFLSANNNVNSAKTLINECKRLIADFDLGENSDCEGLKNNINNCDIDSLVEKVENTKESLMKLNPENPEFANDYMRALMNFIQTSTIDTSNMTDEERLQYNIQMDAYARDYNLTLLYMLEKYEESGLLTDELAQQLQYQREVTAQYEIQDKMAVLDPSTDEYIELFKQSADCDRKLINLNPSLTEDEKASYLTQYNLQYAENLGKLTDARDARLKRETDEKELNELYAAKQDNNGFFHPFVESEIDEAILNKKIEMGVASEDEIAYKNMNGWDRFVTDTKTFSVSTFTGLFNITEGIGDGAVMLSSVLGTDEYRAWASEYISRDISGELYQGIVLSNDMNTYSAYGTWHDAGETFGGFIGKVGMSFAAPWANAIFSGLGAMGQTAETSFNEGDGYWAALAKSSIAGIGGAAEGYGYSKLNLDIRNFASSGALNVLGGQAGKVVKNFGAKLTSPGGLKIIGGKLWNLTKSGVKKLPAAVWNSFLGTLTDPDALIETGCSIANNVTDSVVSGEWDVKKMISEAGTVFAINYAMEFATTLSFSNTGKKANTENSNDAARKLDNFFERYRSGVKTYGVDQHVTSNIIPSNNGMKNFNQFYYMRDKLINMGFSSDDAIRVLKNMDTAGVCSYASLCNEIFATFSNNPSKFEDIFGFPMISYLDDGTEVLNGPELLTDIFIYQNDVSNRGELFFRKADGTIEINYAAFNSREILYKKQKYMALSDFRCGTDIDAYLKSKSLNIGYDTGTIISKMSKVNDVNPPKMTPEEILNFKNGVQQNLDNGKVVSMSFFQNNGSPHSITMYNLDGGYPVNTKCWTEGLQGKNVTGHSVFITDVAENGVIVSSWGEKYFITFEDLSYAPFGVTASSIIFD